MKKFKPNGRALIVLQATSFLLAIILTVLVLIYLDRFKTLMICLICIFWILTILLAFLLWPIYFNKSVIYLSEEELSAHTTFIFSNRSHMRLSAVQYVSVMRLPLAKLLGLNFVNVHGMGASMILPFLSYDDSETIIEILTKEIRSRN